MREFYKKHWDTITNIAIFVATIGIVVIAIKLVIPYFLPFLLGLIMAVMMEPLVNLFLWLRMPRAWATGMALIIAMGSFFAIMWFIISKLVIELAKFLANMPLYTRMFKSLSFTLAYKLQSLTEGLPPEFVFHMNKNTEMLTQLFSDRLSLIVREVLKIITSLPNQLLLIVIILIASFFLSKDLKKIKRRVVISIPAHLHNKVKVMADDIYRATIGFIKAQIILSSIASLAILVGLAILHTEYVVTIALLGGIVSPIPVLGVGALFIPWIAYNLLIGNNYLAVGLLILFAVVVVVKHSLEPKILGENIGIDPLSVLIALYVGYKALGAYGFILGPFILITYNALQKAKAFTWIFQQSKECEENNTK
ncbi:MAG: pheromone autoinducer 2 transporter [Pelotomaculum sp. PtaU1.Bin035]|nr:MAG: pheromone autoinducer 2 transporter [Pelotomaculum sp. PtaU1.Bin035]